MASGSAAVAQIALEHFPPTYFAGTAALADLVQLVFDLGGKARTHEFLQRRYYEVIAEMLEHQEPSTPDVARWESALYRLYAEEPPPMRALDAVAFNAAVDALGRGDHARVKITLWQSALRHFVSFNNVSFELIEPQPSYAQSAPILARLPLTLVLP